MYFLPVFDLLVLQKFCSSSQKVLLQDFKSSAAELLESCSSKNLKLQHLSAEDASVSLLEMLRLSAGDAASQTERRSMIFRKMLRLPYKLQLFPLLVPSCEGPN